MCPLPEGKAQFPGWLSLEQSALTTHSLEPGQHRSGCPLCSVLPAVFSLSCMECKSGMQLVGSADSNVLVMPPQRWASGCWSGERKLAVWPSFHLTLRGNASRQTPWRPVKAKADATFLKAREKGIIVALTETTVWSLDSRFVRRGYVCCWILNS